jgi:hypothetical protein
MSLYELFFDATPDPWSLGDPQPSIDSWPFRRGERVEPSKNADGSTGRPWTERFIDDVFDPAGMDISKNPRNIVRLPNHKRAAHPHEYHRAVYTRLKAAVDRVPANATTKQIREAVEAELDALRNELLDPTTELAKLVTKDNPDCPNGPFQF